MELRIHRGTDEIGGSCVEISTAKTTILVDLGEPLDKSGRRINLKDKKIDGVLISHPHMDHYGQICFLDKNIPIHMGKLGKDFLDTVATFTTGKLPQNNFEYFKKNVPFPIGDITITPFLVDHSSMDAYAFLIQADGKAIVYSGDFRATGYKGFLFDDVIHRIKEKSRNIDAMLMEGTCIARDDSIFPDEKSVANELRQILKKQTSLSFLVSSSSTIDRMVSTSLVCEQTDKIFV